MARFSPNDDQAAALDDISRLMDPVSGYEKLEGISCYATLLMVSHHGAFNADLASWRRL